MAGQNDPRDLLLLRGARIVLPDRIAEDSCLLIEDGRIARITASPSPQLSRAAAARELNGLTLYPGFIDLHIHGAVGIDTMAATSEDLLSVSKFLATQGVSGWLPTLVPALVADYESAVTAIEGSMQQQAGAQGSLGARMLGVHYEGPFVNAMQCGALRSEHFKSFSGPADVDALAVPKNDAPVRMTTLAPEIEGGIDLVRELTRRGWVTSIGHTRAAVEVLERAFEAGARHMTHFMNAMAPLHHRAPGPVGWGLTRDDVTCDVIADGIHLDPVVLQLLLRTKGADRLSLISDAIAAAGKGDGAYDIWGETIEVTNGRTSNSRGSIAGSVITMLDAVRMMLSLGASDFEVARMASTNPARLLRIDGFCGSIEEGKRADLVALDQEGNVRLTIVGGHLSFETVLEA